MLLVKILRPLVGLQIDDTHTRTHTHLTALCPGLPGWAGTRKVKPIWILLKQETVSGSDISWAICRSAPRSRQITTPAPHRSVFLQAGCPSCRPTNSVRALKAYRLATWGENWCGAGLQLNVVKPTSHVTSQSAVAPSVPRGPSLLETVVSLPSHPRTTVSPSHERRACRRLCRGNIGLSINSSCCVPSYLH